MTPKDVLMEYNKRKSVNETAMELGISNGVVRKCLIEYGIIKTPLTERIAELRRIGMPQKDIADMLGVSTSCVNANTPYERGMTITPSQTVNAQRIRKCREKKAGAAE